MNNKLKIILNNVVRTCVLANLFKKDVVLGLDLRKLLIWKATTGRG